MPIDLMNFPMGTPPPSPLLGSRPFFVAVASLTYGKPIHYIPGSITKRKFLPKIWQN